MSHYSEIANYEIKFKTSYLKQKYGIKQSNPITDLDWPLGFQEVEAPIFLDNRHMKEAMLSVLRTGQLYPQKILLVLISVRG
jgi:hypothetical protein